MAEIVKAVVKNHIDTAANLTAANLTPYAGEITIESDTGYIKIGDGVNSWNSLEYTSKTYYDSTISGASDVSTELPDPSDIVGEITFTRSGSGAGKRILTVPTGVTVDWGDATVLNGTIELEGTGKVVVRASGGNIKVDEYEDSGVTTDGGWRKLSNGVVDLWVTDPSVSTTNAVAGSVFYDTTSYAWGFGLTLSTTPSVIPGAIATTGLGWGIATGVTTTGCNLTLVDFATAKSGYVTGNATGRWRA